MTLKECKQTIAIKMGFKDWSDLKNNHSKDGLEITMGEVAELYARSKWDEALKAAVANAKLSILLKERGKDDWGPIVSDTARLQSGAQVTIDVDSILNLKP